jgi:hypothetical protein
LKKEPGRPFGRKTPLAILRHMIKVERIKEKTISLKRTGKEKTIRKVNRVTLPVSTLAKWLNIPDDRVRCIERNRPGYRLTAENATVLMLQTGVSPGWLLANDISKPIMNWRDEPYTLRDFEERQRVLSRPDANLALEHDLAHARMTVALSSAKIAAILARGFERGKVVEYAIKINQALRSIFSDKGEKFWGWPGGFEPSADFANGHFDIGPTLRALEIRARSIDHEKREPECPTCLGQSVVACPNCILPVAEVKSKIVKRLLVNEKTGGPVNCEICKNNRIVRCRTCKGTGYVGIEPPRR